MTSSEDIKRTKFCIVIANVIDDDETKKLLYLDIPTIQNKKQFKNLKTYHEMRIVKTKRSYHRILHNCMQTHIYTSQQGKIFPCLYFVIFSIAIKLEQKNKESACRK